MWAKLELFKERWAFRVRTSRAAYTWKRVRQRIKRAKTSFSTVRDADSETPTKSCHLRAIRSTCLTSVKNFRVDVGEAEPNIPSTFNAVLQTWLFSARSLRTSYYTAYMLYLFIYLCVSPLLRLRWFFIEWVNRLSNCYKFKKKIRFFFSYFSRLNHLIWTGRIAM